MYVYMRQYLCEEPFRNGVGAESAMVDCEAGCISLVHQVQVEARQVAGAEHALVDDRLAGQRAGIRLCVLDLTEVPLSLS